MAAPVRSALLLLLRPLLWLLLRLTLRRPSPTLPTLRLRLRLSRWALLASPSRLVIVLRVGGSRREQDHEQRGQPRPRPI
jgi:hypothetical protein